MNTAISRQKRHRIQRGLLTWQKYRAVLSVSIANNLAYLTEAFFRTLITAVMVFILSQLWKTTFDARGAKTISGFSKIWNLNFGLV